MNIAECLFPDIVRISLAGGRLPLTTRPTASGQHYYSVATFSAILSRDLLVGEVQLVF